jgi:predicted metallopeptidase
LLFGIGFPQHVPTCLFRDNQAAIWLVNNLEFINIKHIDIIYHLIHKFQAKAEINVIHAPTIQFANIFAKALILEKFNNLHCALNIIRGLYQEVEDYSS